MKSIYALILLESEKAYIFMIWIQETNLLFNIADRKLLLVCSPCPTADCQNKTKWPNTSKKCFLDPERQAKGSYTITFSCFVLVGHTKFVC